MSSRRSSPRRSSSRRSSSRSSTRGSSRRSHENRRSRSRSSSDRSYSPSQHRRKNRRHSSTSSKSSRRSGNDSGDRLSFGHTPRSSDGSRLGPVSPSEYNIDFNKNIEYMGDDVSNLEPASPAAYWNGNRHANGNNNNSRSPGPYNPIGSISSSSSSSSSSSRASSLARSIPLGDIMPVAGENNYLENRRVGFMGMERIPTAQDVRHLIRHHTASIAMLKEYANQMGYKVEWYVKGGYQSEMGYLNTPFF